MARNKKLAPKVLSLGLLCYRADEIPIMSVYVEYREEIETDPDRYNHITKAGHFRGDCLSDEDCANYERDWRCWEYMPTPEHSAAVRWKT